MQKILVKTIAKAAVAIHIFAIVLTPKLAFALSAEIVARVDGVIITERDVTNRAELLYNNFPSAKAHEKNVRAWALDTLVLEQLQKQFLIDERALEVNDKAVEKRKNIIKNIWFGVKTKKSAREKKYDSQLEQIARQGLTWEGYVNRVANFNNPLNVQDMLSERKRISNIAEEKQYLVEEIFLPQITNDKATQLFAQSLYKDLIHRTSFTRLSRFLQSFMPSTHRNTIQGAAYLSAKKSDAYNANLNTNAGIFYKSELPPALSQAIEKGNRQRIDILPPITSPHGMHIYRIQKYKEKRRSTRYTFLQAIFLESAFQGAQALAIQSALIQGDAICKKTQQVAAEIGAYDITTAEDIPEQDLSAEILQVLKDLSLKASAGPFPFAQGLIVFFILCDKKNVLQRGDTQEQILSRLQKKRTGQLALNIIEKLQIDAEIEHANK